MQSLYERQVEAIVGALGVAPPGKLTALVGDTVRVTLTVKYRGQAISGKIHVTFGQKATLFNEDGNKQTDIPVYIGGNTGTNYDLYAKIMSVPGADIFTSTYMNVLDVLGAPEFQDFRITDYSKV